ncbi:MAG: hypothetical protein GC134_05635 [Proteobacteria bacterium]|nr:hypothetical protein [Pseudomonadota bacterium]
MKQIDFNRLTSQQVLDHATTEMADLFPEGFRPKALRCHMYHEDGMAEILAYKGSQRPVPMPDVDARPTDVIATGACITRELDHVPQGFNMGTYRLYVAYHELAHEMFNNINTRFFDAIGAKNPDYRSYIDENVADRFAALMVLRDTGDMTTLNVVAHQRLAAVVNGVDLGPDEVFVPAKDTVHYTTPTLRDAMMCPPARLEELDATTIMHEHVLGHFFYRDAHDEHDICLRSDAGLLSGDEFELFDRDVRHPNTPIARDMTTLYYMKSHPLLTGEPAPENAVEKHLFRERVETHLVNDNSGYDDLCYRLAYLESTRRIQRIGGMDEFVVLGPALTQTERDEVLDDMLDFYQQERDDYAQELGAVIHLEGARERA